MYVGEGAERERGDNKVSNLIYCPVNLVGHTRWRERERGGEKERCEYLLVLFHLHCTLNLQNPGKKKTNTTVIYISFTIRYHQPILLLF